MKGTYFQKPLEFRLEVEGESWSQGDPVQGTLIIKNHGPEAIATDDMRVQLAYGELKKVRAKDASTFEIMATSEVGGGKVEPQKELRHSWRFETDRNAPITDKTDSLFLLYGQGTPEKLGQLQLIFNPYSLIQEFVERLKLTYRFVVKSQKSNKGWVEVKFAAPAAKAFATLEGLILNFRFDGEALEVRYQFQIKKIEATAASMDMKKEKKQVTQRLEKNHYLTPSGRVNHDQLEASIREAVGQFESKIIF